LTEEREMAEDVVGQRHDPDKNQLPYGGAVDMNGWIVWAVTEEEDKATHERICKAFGKK
jgi:hypothetical protein